MANTKCCRNPEKTTETLAHEYSSESTQQELSNEYQHDRVKMVFKKIMAKVASALEWLTSSVFSHYHLTFTLRIMLFDITILDCRFEYHAVEGQDISPTQGLV